MSKWIVDIHGDIEGDYDLICKAESAIPLDKVKEVRERISNKIQKDPYLNFSYRNRERNDAFIEALEILDKLIESEE